MPVDRLDASSPADHAEDARLEPIPERVVPMLARLDGVPAEQDDYGFEVKWDGIRAIGYWEPGRWRLRGDMRRSKALGALLVGHWVAAPAEAGDRQRLKYVGKVGIGYSEADRATLRERLEPLRRDDSPFTGRQPVENAIFVEPVLVAGIDFHEWTAAGMLRQPSYKGLRTDLDTRQVVAEATGDLRIDHEERARSPRAARGEADVEVDGRRLHLTSLRKVLYPEAGLTKAAVLDYHARIASTLLPHVRGRAMTLKRYPEGVEGPHFYKTHCAGRPDWLRTARRTDKDREREVDRRPLIGRSVEPH